jgi:hypothetical protein
VVTLVLVLLRGLDSCGIISSSTLRTGEGLAIGIQICPPRLEGLIFVDVDLMQTSNERQRPYPKQQTPRVPCLYPQNATFEPIYAKGRGGFGSPRSCTQSALGLFLCIGI